MSAKEATHSSEIIGNEIGERSELDVQRLGAWWKLKDPTLRSLVFDFFFSSRRRHTRWPRDWSSDVCSSDLEIGGTAVVGDIRREAREERRERVAGQDQVPREEDAADGERGKGGAPAPARDEQHDRSEERRVGKEGRARLSGDE